MRSGSVHLERGGSRNGHVSAAVAVVAICLSLSLSAFVGVDPVYAQSRSVVVVGDSIVLGAQTDITDQFVSRGWSVTFDGSVSRSTLAGLDAIEAHGGELTDSLVIGLGANDAGSPDTFRARASRVLDATRSVPHVYWLTIPEVRDYYSVANDVLRSLRDVYPNLVAIEWAAVAAVSGLTASDGLHLTPSGSATLSLVVVNSVLGTGDAAASTTASPAAPVPATPGDDAATVGRDVGAASISARTGSETSRGRDASRPARRAPRSFLTLFGLTVGIGFFVMVLILGMSGVVVGSWSLVSSGKSRD